MKFRSLALVFALSLAACGGSSPSTDAAPAAQADQAWVVQATFDRAFTIVKGVDYLPFQYKIDGCYARALYMSMELAAQGMESNEVFAFAQSGNVLQVGDVQWGYHVAPMLMVGASADKLVHVVIDPSLSTKPITETEWLGMMGVADPNAADAPQMLIAPGSDYAPQSALADTDHNQRDTPDLQHMPSFKASDIQSACGVMHDYLGREAGATDDTIAQKRQKLLLRTTQLLDQLGTRSKLVKDVDFSADTCASGRGPA